MKKSQRLKRWTGLIAVLFSTYLIFTPLEGAAGKDDPKLVDTRVDVISFNDFHGQLEERGKTIGAAKLAEAIKAVVKANPNSVVVAGGDLYQGSAMSNLTYGKPVSEFLKYIGLTASAVGNHEFDWGTEWIKQWSQDGGFSFLASNIYSKTTKKPVTWANPYIIVERDGRTIGFIGISTPETAFKTKPENVEDLEFRDPVESANYWAKYLREVKKVDAVVALTHLGASHDSKTGVITGEAAELAEAAKGIDAIISAHTHMMVSGYVNNIPILQACYNGGAIATLSIDFNLEGKILRISPSVNSLYNNVSDIPADPKVEEIVARWKSKLAPVLNEIIGSTDKELTHDRNKPGVSMLGQWVSEVMRERSKTQIAITNGGAIRLNSLAKGNITMGDMYNLMPFENTLVKMEIKGADLKKVLENGIGNEAIGWVQFTGVKVYYDLSKPIGERILGMYMENGKKVDMNKYYTVVTNDFMAKGGDGFDFTSGRNVIDTGIPIRETLVESLRKLKAEGKSLSLITSQNAIEGNPPADDSGSYFEQWSLVDITSLLRFVGEAL